MSDNARRERDAALAALDSHPGADESVMAAPVTGAHAVVAQQVRGGPSAGAVVAGGGLVAALAGLDQLLQQHGTTLADLTMRSGPLSGSLVANWPIVVLGAWGLWLATRRWQEHVAWTHIRAAASDKNSRNQVRAIRAVAEEVAGLRGEVSAQAAIAQSHAGRLDAVERDVRDLRGRMPERRSHPRSPD